MFSARSSIDLEPNRLAVALSAALARAEVPGQGHRGPILDLTQSNPTRAGLPYPDEAIVGALGSTRALTYEPTAFGLASAREAVACDLSEDARADGAPPVDPRRLVLTASTSEAYAFLFKLLANPGDSVLVPRPSYPLFEHLARLECVEAAPYRLAYDGAWHVDLDSVRRAVTPRTRAVVVVAPNNPTGSYLKRDELDALASLGLPLVSDEVFARFPFRADTRRVATARASRDARLVFTLGGLSKLAALPQMKLAWMTVDGESDVAQAALARLEVIADAFLSVGTPVQHAAPVLLATARKTRDAIRARTAEHLAYLHARAEGSALSVLDVEGGWYATLRLPRTESEESWALSFLERDGVYVHPGHFFDFEEEAYAIVSLLTEPAVFREGIDRIVARVALL
jgi:alanine-synthesizing transaminase